MSVRAKLYISYMVIILLTAGMGFYALVSMDKINLESTKLSKDSVPKLVISARLNRVESDYRKYEAMHIATLSPQDMAQIEDSPREQSKLFDENIESILAMALLRGEAYTLDKELSEKLIAYTNTHIEQSEALSKEGEDLYESSKYMLMVMASVIFIFSVMIAIYISRYILSFITAFISVSEVAAAGDLRQNLQFTGRDKFGKMAGAYNDMQEKVKTLLLKIQESAQQLAASSEELTAGANQSAEVTGQIAQSVATVAVLRRDN